MIAGKAEVDLAGADDEGEAGGEEDQRRQGGEESGVDERVQEHLRRKIHEERQQHHEDEDDRQPFDAGNQQWRQLLGHLLAGMILLERDQKLGQLHHRHVLGQYFRNNAAAVEHDQAIGDLMHVGKIVLDVNRSPAGILDPPDEIENLADLLDRQRDGRLVEDDEVGVVVHGAADGDALALAAGEVGNGGIRR